MKWERAVLRHLLAVALVILATLLTRRTEPVLGEIAPFFFVAVMLSAWFGGLWPGLLATALSGWASAYFFYDIPSGTGIFGWDDGLRLTIFLMIALLTSFLLNMRQRAERGLRNAMEHLEIRVLDRTRELEASNRKVRESEEGLKALIDGVTDCAICMLDQNGIIVQWNSGAARIQGYSHGEILHQHFSVFFLQPGGSKKRADELIQRAAKTGRADDEGWRIRSGRSPFWAHVIITPLFDETGSLRGFAHVARDITQLKRLEKEVIDISEQEQRRIGHDLHDGLGQELTGVAFLCQNIARKLTEAGRPEAVELSRISSLINAATEKTRDLAAGLSPVEWGPDGLAAALQNLSKSVTDIYGIRCEFRRGRASEVEVDSHAAAVNLYRIAQEALSNAARHSHATRIWLSVDGGAGELAMSIEDDGIGIDRTTANGKGMGLHLMPYRARTIGAAFDLYPRPAGGTIVRCVYRRSSETFGDHGFSVAGASR